MEMFFEIPVVTRSYVMVSVITTMLCACELLTPYSLYLSWEHVKNGQVWRLFTNFVFFGAQFNLDFFFHMFFLGRYCRSLEESSFRGRTADFVWLLILASSVMTMLAPLLKLNFLAASLTFMLVYIWGRRNPFARLNFMGVFNFSAPYLAYVLLGFSMLLGQNGAIDMLGIFVGHLYYFLEDVYPQMIPSHTRVLRTPAFLKHMLGE